MFRRLFPPSSDAASDAARAGAGSRARPTAGEPDLATFPVIGITRRRAAALLGALVVAWIVILFARQVSDAAQAADRSAALLTANAQRTAEVASLERELQQIQEPAYVDPAGPRLRSWWAARDRLQSRARRPASPAGLGRVRGPACGCPGAGRPTGALADVAVRPAGLIAAARRPRNQDSSRTCRPAILQR